MLVCAGSIFLAGFAVYGAVSEYPETVAYAAAVCAGVCLLKECCLGLSRCCEPDESAYIDQRSSRVPLNTEAEGQQYTV